jgi:coenzyme PQQ biosynthesis protein PqqD
VIARGTPLALARKARLRLDPRSGKTMLLYPERGLELSDSAARIARLCAEGRTADAIVDELAAGQGVDIRARIDAEVMAFLRSLEERGLLVAAGGPGPGQGGV